MITRPTRLPNFEKNCVEEAISLSVSILFKVLCVESTSFLPVLIRIFDRTVPYYAGIELILHYFRPYINIPSLGMKTVFNSFPGNPALRLATIKKFGEGNGFQLLCVIIKEHAWLGPEFYFVVVKAILDVSQNPLVSLVAPLLCSIHHLHIKSYKLLEGFFIL